MNIYSRSISFLVMILLCFSANAEDRSASLDLMSDDFDVFRYIGNNYLEMTYHRDNIESIKEFGLTYRSHGDKAYPKTGFIGYQINSRDGQEIIVKIQLYKDAKGWRLVGVLDNSKIHQANPSHVYMSGHTRTDESTKARIAAATGLEKWLNQNNLIADIRSTAMNCYLNKRADNASCHGIYGLKSGEDTKCSTKSYLLNNKGGKWEITKEINYDQKVRYSTGELVQRKPFPVVCN